MSTHHSIKSLTFAALALPGIVTSTDVSADEEEGSFTYGYYQEGKRNLYGLPNNIQPIRVDTISSTGKIATDPFNQFSFNYIQD